MSPWREKALEMTHRMTTVDRIEPPSWYCGMKSPTVQVMVCGHGIGHATVEVDYPGVTVEKAERLDSDNYLFVTLNVSEAVPGAIPLVFSDSEGEKFSVYFPMLEREKRGEERIGFSNEDVLYLLMPDRFAQGHDDNSHIRTNYPYTIDRTAPSLRHGGDLEGIRRHLDYLADLGVTALWLTPVLENDQMEIKGQSCYHGYATTNYYRVDPRLGTNEEYRTLIDEAHGKGLKVVMDMIFNHCGDKHPWMADPPSNDWFNSPDYGLQTSYKLTPVVDPYASEIDFRETVDGWFVRSMPDLNQRNQHLLTYLIQNSLWWIETAGIDGIRMDTYPYADAQAMAQWMTVINEEYPNFNVVGESWVTEPAFTAALQKDSRITPFPHGSMHGLDAEKHDKGFNTELKSVMDFAFFERINLAKSEDTDEWWEGYNRIYNTLVYDYLYPRPDNVLAFLDNHDTDRFLDEGNDVTTLRQALALLLTMRRIPQLYYGTEILMRGTKTITDGHVRKDFPGGFPGDKRNAFTPEGRTKAENAMFSWLRTLLHWRRGNKVITEGRQVQFIPWKGVYVTAHELDGRYVMVIINGTSSTADFLWERFREVIPEGTVAREVTTNRRHSLCRNIRLRKRQVLVLEY